MSKSTAKLFLVSCLAAGLVASCGNGGVAPEQVSPQPSPSDGGTAAEKKIAALVRGHSKQSRKQLNWDARLSKSARQRALDMANRGYFDHVDPDGNGPNYYVSQAGYKLPIKWTAFRAANQVESIVAGHATAESAFAHWMTSPKHVGHLLARDIFYEDQTSFGVGHAYVPGSPFGHYWVFHSAPPKS